MKVNFEQIKLSTILKIAAVIGALAIIASVFISNYKSSYNEMVHDWRKQKDYYFMDDPESPIENKESFKGLEYFEPNLEFKTDAHITMLNDSTSTVINRTDGKKEKYLRYAIATFKLKDKEYQLILFKSLKHKQGDTMLFVPFTDRTSGELTYGGGRYLDIHLKEPDKAVIDFNYAYNPYCAYNPRFSCPIPPKENYIDVDILVGEKLYKKSIDENSDSLSIH